MLGRQMSVPMRYAVLTIAFLGLVRCEAQLDAGEMATADAGFSADAAGAVASSLDHADAEREDAARQGCTSCHGGENAAPPRDLTGHNDPTFPGVGAHQTHLRGTPRSRPVPCFECHVVPPSAPNPLDKPRPAQVTFSGAASAFGATPIYAGATCSHTACHGERGANGNASGAGIPSPVWTKVDGTQATCGACHGLPPPPPHPEGPLVCAGCHKDVAEDYSFLRPERHVDGLVTFTLPP
jgi:predicted CxxxxCH...CXXCH cytochrome family protein